MYGMAQTIAQALAPICFCVFLGWTAGRAKIMPTEYGRALARFVVLFALPIALFIAATKANPRDIFDLRTLLALLAGFGLTFLMGWLGGQHLFHHNRADSAVQALTCSFPNISYCGPPVLIASVGSSALLMVVTGNLVAALVIVPIALIIMTRNATEEAHKVNFTGAVLHALRQPLLVLPITGALLAVLGVKLPQLAVTSANEVGVAAGGTALFALGLILSAIPLRLDGEIAFNVFVKNVIQPIVILFVAYALGLRGPQLAQVFLLGVLPTAAEVSAIAVARNTYSEKAAGSTIISVLVSIVTISAGVATARFLQS
ncbi:AEC family transporter [Rhizobium sp. Root1220]|uniref:AEC family transporter n=1 Tax=Rhizobium sp. Root1220 TaxID=1736432 RepID=UPI0006FFD9D1|nr:AEC family transporter [Rhizobium sp. Root1220]KQV68100.1 hypothetical protein ASC90_10615 [Rhizobium sp. Root1220]